MIELNEESLFDRPDLLHNMSSRASTTISHEQPRQRSIGIGLVFRISKRQSVQPATLLKALKRGAPGSMEASERLREVINDHSLQVPLSAALPVTAQAKLGDFYCCDLLTVLTVLSKSSSHVYLRDKEPNLSRLREVRRVVLIASQNSKTELMDSALFEQRKVKDD